MARFEAGMEAMLDMFVFETDTLLTQLEELLMRTEKEDAIGSEDINEIFRIMHTIKGSSAMMGLRNMSALAHSVEDLFYILRENPDTKYNKSELYALLFKAFDCLKGEVAICVDESAELSDFTAEMEQISACADKIKAENGGIVAREGENAQASPTETNAVKADIFVASELSDDTIFGVKVLFDEACQMPNIRAMLLLKGLKNVCEVLKTIPENVGEDASAEGILQDGLLIKLKTDDIDAVYKKIRKTLNVSDAVPIIKEKPKPKKSEKPVAKPVVKPTEQASMISVKLSKLDELLDLVSEIVITESMLTAIKKLQNDEDFQKPARQLRKLTDELQDVVMSVRMLPISVAFSKMSRIVRDMNLKLGKSVELVFEGEETEVDKTVIDALNDPLMHLVRNSMDHGIETDEERIATGKTEKPRVTLSASSAAGEVVIKISDNGKGMDAEKLLAKASKNGLLVKPASDYTHAEALKLIMLAGFSTNEKVTEFSGRGVGMDVVRQNIEKIRGTINVASELGRGTEFTIKIPLTLSILDGMELRVGESFFTVPVLTVREAFKADPKSIVTNPDGSELVMIRDKCYPVIRLHKEFGIDTAVKNLKDGIMLRCNADGQKVCLFADELVGEISVVVKPFPTLINRMGIKDHGLTGCAILGDGSITLIVDVKTLVTKGGN